MKMFFIVKICANIRLTDKKRYAILYKNKLLFGKIFFTVKGGTCLWEMAEYQKSNPKY